MADRGAPVTLVTGGIQGIGRAIVDALIARKDHVVVFDYVAPSDARVVALPDACEYHRVDVSSHAAVQAAVADVVATHGRIDCLVNNAGVTADGLAVRLSPAQWERVIAVNLNGTFWCAQAVLPQMMRQRSGSIISMSSIVAMSGNAGQAPYAASKAGIEALTKTLAREYGGRGIRVNAIAPGLITTPLTDALPEAAREQAVARTSMRRAGNSEEVADLVCFLSSEKSSYITGQIIHINGGMW